MKLIKDKKKKPMGDSLYDDDNRPKGKNKALVRIKVSKVGEGD